MESVTTNIVLDVTLTESERKTVKKLLDRKDIDVLADAKLIVNVAVKVEEKKP